VQEIAVNPPASELGRVNAILAGRARRYDECFAGPLSIKSVVRGAAVWTTGGARFEVTPYTALLLNDGEEYEIEVDAREPVETFCVFFAHGFVEEAMESATTASAKLLEGQARAPILHWSERWMFDDVVLRALSGVRRESSDGSLYTLANAIVGAQCDLDTRVAQMSLVRATTRDEIRRRVARGIAFIHGSIGDPFTVADVAREACLSRFHFHRLFTAMTGETPHRYIARIRLERARAMLRDRQRSVGEVALASGFATPSAFSSAFSKHFGYSPKKQL